MSANNAPQRLRAGPARHQRGLSIVELMVGIVIALLVALAATGSAMMFTASQRQGIGAGGVAVNSSTALAALKSDAAAAGLGFFGVFNTNSQFLCDTLDLSVNAATLIDGAAFVPVRITEEGTDDRVDLIYGNRVEGGANVLLDSAYATATGSADLMSFLPAAVGQAVLLAPPTPGGVCVVRSITAITASTDTTPQVLAFDNTGLHNKVAFSVPPAVAIRGRVSLLGELAWHRYRRIGTTLVLERPFTGDSAVLARNVMALRMQYGVSAAVGQTSLDDFVDANGAVFGALAAANLQRVRALRIGMITRSPQREKPPGGDVTKCEATPVIPQLFGENITTDVGADWRCYRYSTSTVVVPLRNLVYGMRAL